MLEPERALGLPWDIHKLYHKGKLMFYMGNEAQ